MGLTGPRDEPCGYCDTCDAGTAHDPLPPSRDDDLTPSTPVRHPRWGAGSVLETESDRLTVLFDE